MRISRRLLAGLAGHLRTFTDEAVASWAFHSERWPVTMCEGQLLPFAPTQPNCTVGDPLQLRGPSFWGEGHIPFCNGACRWNASNWVYDIDAQPQIFHPLKW